MYLEVKALFSALAIIFIAIVTGFIMFESMVLGFLGFMAIGFIVFGDIIIGYIITSTGAKYWYERPPANKEFGIVVDLTGLVTLIWADKKPEGKREFVYNAQEASVINEGNYPIHTPAGARGFIAHESLDTNVNLFEAKAAEHFKEHFNTDNIKELYYKAKVLDGVKDE